MIMAAAGLALWLFTTLIYCNDDFYLTNRFGIATLFIFPEIYFLLAATALFAFAQYIDPHAAIQSIQGTPRKIIWLGLQSRLAMFFFHARHF